MTDRGDDASRVVTARPGEPTPAERREQLALLAYRIHKERGEPKGYQGPCWGPTPEDYDEARRRLADEGQPS